MKGKRSDGQPVAFHHRMDRKALYWRRGRPTEDGDVVFPDGRKLSAMLRALHEMLPEGVEPDITITLRLPQP